MISAEVQDFFHSTLINDNLRVYVLLLGCETRSSVLLLVVLLEEAVELYYDAGSCFTHFSAVLEHNYPMLAHIALYGGHHSRTARALQGSSASLIYFWLGFSARLISKTFDCVFCSERSFLFGAPFAISGRLLKFFVDLI